MSSRAHGRPLLLALAAGAAMLGAAGAACYRAPELAAPYRCLTDGTCGDTGMTCDDGICCEPGGTPACPSYVTDAGTCPDGGMPQTFYQDLDGDHHGNPDVPKPYCIAPAVDPFVASKDDCNDNPLLGGAAMYPGATELCDGLDNDCDGVLDNGFPKQNYWRDQDNDGFGDPAQMVEACAAPPGYVANASDCAPDNPAINPNKPEVCNGIDDDCNGMVDDGIPGAGLPCSDPNRKGICANGVTDCVSGQMACRQTVFPQTEICDGLDNDCDGVLDNGFTQTTFYRDQDNDGYGDPNLTTTACQQPAGYVTNNLDCGPDNPGAHPGAKEYCDGVDNSCDGRVDERPACGGPQTFANAGTSVTFGVKRIDNNNNPYWGSPNHCLMNDAASPLTPADALDVAGLVWTGTGYQTHVFWARAAGGTSWDLSRSGQKLWLRVDESINSTNTTTKWADIYQPVLMICGANGQYIRLVHGGTSTEPIASDAHLFQLDLARNSDVDNYVYLRSGNGWVIGSGSATDMDGVLRAVDHIEVLVQPESAAPPANFILDFYNLNFGFP